MEFAEQQPMKAIFLKVSSVAIFVCMSTLIKAAGEGITTGQITFYRSAFAMVPIMAWLAVRGELVDSFRTSDILGHLGRGFVGILAIGLVYVWAKGDLQWLKRVPRAAPSGGQSGSQSGKQVRAAA